MEHSLGGPSSPRRVWHSELPREVRLSLTFVTAFAVYYLLFAALQVFYLHDTPTVAYLQHEGILLGAVAVLVTLAAAFQAFRRGTPGLPYVRPALALAGDPGLFLLWIWLGLACVNGVLASRAFGTRLMANRWQLFDIFACAVLLCPLGFALARLRDPRPLYRIMDLGLLFCSVLALVGMRTLFTGQVIRFLGHTLHMRGGRLSLGLNANVVGAYAAMFLFVGLYRLHTVQSAPARLPLWAAMVLWFFTLAGTASRAAILAAAAGFGAYAAFALRRRKQSRRWTDVLLSILAGMAAAAVFYWLCQGALSLVYLLEKQALSPGAQLTTDERANAATFGGRMRLWKNLLRDMIGHPRLLLHGCGPSNIYPYVGEHLFSHPTYTHNQYLEILLGQGLMPMLIYTAWTGVLAVRSVRLCLLPREDDRAAHWTLPLLLLVLVIDNLAEAMLAGTTHFCGHLFFLAAGFVSGLVSRRNST